MIQRLRPSIWSAIHSSGSARSPKIVSVADNEVVGTVGLLPVEDMFVLGYWVGRAHNGQGYASEAVRLVVEYARSRGATKLFAETFPENVASGRVLAKAGFVLTGTTERDFPLRGGMRTNNQYLLKLK